MAKELADKLNDVRPRGYTATQRKTIADVIDGLASFFEVTYQGGALKPVKIGEEQKLQSALRDHLRSRGYKVDEAQRVSGGAIDLLFGGYLTIENKIHKVTTDDPLGGGIDYPWQARRYAIPTATDIVVTVVGYQPKTEAGHLKGRDLIEVRRFGASPGAKDIEIRLAVPIGYSDPSAAKAPKKPAKSK